jgi:hypothetical protein
MKQAVWVCFWMAVLATPGTLLADDRAPVENVDPVDSLQSFFWWKHSWFPFYHWTGYNIRPYFGVSPVYPETFLRSMSAVRYNRVDGVTMGIGIPRLARLKVGSFYTFGQLSYAFSLDKVRYRAGLELPVTRSPDATSRLLVGGSIYSNTTTNDLWKISDGENSLAAFVAKDDHLDYFDTYGWSSWLVGELGAYTQISLTYRDDRYSSLHKNTNWSIFGGDPFRSNPGIDEGRMHSAILRLEAGRVGGLYSVPQGWSIQGEAELGKGLGGDFKFTRYVADGRWYLSPAYWYGFGIRLRGGFASDQAPLQKTFTIGGLGSVRAWPQNLLRGSRFIVANAEFYLDQIDLLISDLQFMAFADAGWTGYSDTEFLSADETLGAVGVGIGFDQRRVRFEVAMPVGKNGRSEPWFWFRLYPTF